jgi:4-hydroxy-4-methyl-2-oxoglutarate aldolase
MNKTERHNPFRSDKRAARQSRGYDFGSAQTVQAAKKKCSVILGLQSPSYNSYAFGRAFPCRCAPGDNLALHHALKSAFKGVVIICDAGGRLDVGYFGELMALDAKNRGLSGLVINGSVRDARGLDEVGFPVFCFGYAPAQSTKRHRGTVGTPIRLNGIRVVEGDYVVADRDAVVIVPQDAWDSVRRDILEICSNEERIRMRLAARERLWSILELA